MCHALDHAADYADRCWAGVGVGLLVASLVLDGDEQATASLQRWARGDLSGAVEGMVLEALKARGEL
jgi:hypothetical protein